MQPQAVPDGSASRARSAGSPAAWERGLTFDQPGRAELQQDLSRLAQGDREAFDSVFRRVWPMVRSLAMRYLPAEDAEDAAQGALLKLFERSREFDPDRDAVAWTVGVAMWEIRTARRRTWRRRDTVRMEEAADLPVDSASAEDRVVADELAAALGQTLATLRPEDRDALLRYAHDEREVGASFRKRLQRARERMRAAWRVIHG